METIISLAVGIVLGVCFLWVGMKVTKCRGTFLNMFTVVAASSLVGLVPLVGWQLSIIVMFLLIRKLTDAEIWPDAVLMVLVGQEWLLFLAACFWGWGAPGGLIFS